MSVSAVRPRVVFYALRDLHLPVLLPVLREVAALDAFDVGVIAPAFVASGNGRVQEGLSPRSLTELAGAGIEFWGHERRGDYACVVVADACYDRIDGWGPAVCIGHGTISKGLYFTDTPFVRRENFARVLCVPGPGYVTSFGRQLFTRVVPTGFSKMDELVSPAPGHRASVLSRLGLDPDKRTLLFAPTYNPELTSLEILADAWAALDPARDQVLFKLHGATDAAWVARYRALADSLPHARLIEDGSLSTYLVACDVLISDVSSAYVEALVTGVPLVVVNNPATSTYPRFNRADVEYRVRDAAYQVRSAAECHSALEQLRTADPLKAKREKYARQLFAPLDGRNSARIAAEVAAVASSAVPQRLPDDDRIAVYVPDQVTDAARVDANIARAVSPVTVHRGALPPQPFICLTGDFDLPHGWDLLWRMASRFNAPSRKQPIVGVFGPMLLDRAEYGGQRRSACFADAPSLAEPALQTLYKHHAYDQLAATDTLQADGSIVSKGVPRDIAAAWIAQLHNDSGRTAVAKLAAQRGLHIGVIPGIYATRVDQAAANARPDFLFYCFKNVHMALFAPVIAAVRRARPDAAIAFASPAHDPVARHGLTLTERDAFAAATGAEWVSDAAAARPRVTIIADCVADRLRGHRRIVNLGHGLISKGQYYGANALIGRENLADAICVPGPWHAEQLRPHLYIPIHVTGMSKLDGLFAPFDEAAFRAANQFARDERLLLWCPTFNPELSSLPVIGADIRRLTAFGTVVIKMHGTTDAVVAESLRRELAAEPRVRFVDPADDATPFMRAASLMITDVSSVMFEFAALDRPVVLVDNPRQASYVNYRATDVEYQMRDVGVRVSSADELVEAVRDELAAPGRHSAARRRVTAAMFAATDGRNAERIAAVLCEDPAAAPWLGPFDVVLPESFTAQDLAFAAPALKGAATVIGPAAAGAAASGLCYQAYDDSSACDAMIADGASPNVLMFRRRSRLIGDWRAPLFGPLYLGQNAPAMTAPLTTEKASTASYVGRYIKRDRVTLPREISADVLAGIIRITNPGERAPSAELDPAVIAIRRDALNRLNPATRATVVLDALAAQ
jgi:CDP-glycerol glycerophosphotransferase (TagB/SpsB family)